VYLSVQVVSNTVLQLFGVTARERHADWFAREAPLWDSLTHFIELIDHVVDIMNSRIKNDKKTHKISLISKKNQKELEKLLQFSAFLLRWREQAMAAKDPKQFVTREAGEDAIKMGLGAVALCCMLIQHDPTFFAGGGWISFHRLLQDLIENHFSRVRYYSLGAGVNVSSAKKAANASHAVRIFKSSKSNCAGAMENPDGENGQDFDFRNYKPTPKQKKRDAKPILH
jgi:hypothetical protein